MKHGRITTYTPQEDDSLLIRTEGYFEDLNSVKEEIRQNINTTKETLMQDVIKAMEVFTQTDAPELTITMVKQKGEPTRLVKTWIVYKKKI